MCTETIERIFSSKRPKTNDNISRFGRPRDRKIALVFVLGPKHKLPKSKTKLFQLNHKTLGSKDL